MSSPSGGMPQNTGSNSPYGRQQVTEATLIVGTVSSDDSLAQYTAVPNNTWIYTDYEIRNKYEWDGQVLMAGITSPAGFQGNSVAFFQMASPTLLWVADWTASRFNQLPNIPDPDSVSSDWILLDKHFELADIKYGPDGISPIYRVTGTYIFGNSSPSEDAINDISFGISPEFQPPQFTSLSPSQYAPGIIVAKAGGGSNEASAGSPPSDLQSTFGNPALNNSNPIPPVVPTV